MTPDKEIALHSYIQDQIGLPFEFGVNDCPLFAFGALDVLADTNHREEMLGLWNSKHQAWDYAKNHGTIKDHLVEWGCKEVKTYAVTGDFVLLTSGTDYSKGWRSVAVYLGGKVAMMTVDGVGIYSLERMPEVTGVVRYV